LNAIEQIANHSPALKLSVHVQQDQKLRSRIQQQFAIEDTTTELNGQMYPWTRVIDPDRLLEEALRRKDRSPVDLDPFWAAHWRASIGLERFMDSLDMDGERVLDLGCGSGRVGIGAALRGAKVVMTDAVGAAMLIAKYNARFVHENVQIRRLEWKEEQLPGPKFKMIFGSDIVYDPSLHPILEPCLRRHLARDGIVYLSEPQRHTGDRFQRWIVAAGWKLSETYIDLDDGHRPVRIFSLGL
jgi:predicted nicotinamide N-methyase